MYTWKKNEPIISLARYITICLSAGIRYDHSLNPDITNAFAAAAFRFGHSLIPEILSYRKFDLSGSPDGDVSLSEVS